MSGMQRSTQTPAGTDAWREFLPAALEVRDTPPARGGRIVLRVLAGMVACIVLWSVIGRIDVVAVASGRIIPSGRSKPLQSVEAGIVEAVHVREGQQVARGEVLVDLGDRTLAPERDRLAAELDSERLLLAVALALHDVVEQAKPAFDAAFDGAQRQAGLVPGLRAVHRELLVSRWNEYRRDRLALEQRIAAREADAAALQAEVLKLEQALPMQLERHRAATSLLERGLLARQQWLASQLELNTTRQELASARERTLALRAGESEARAQLAAGSSRFKAGVLEQVARHRRSVAALEQELRRAHERSARLALRAPVDGIVQQLAVSGAGAVVRPAEPLLVIVPRDDALEVEALVLNRDIGFVRHRQAAVVKVETFNFTRYGVVGGRVRTVSAEAVEHERLGLVYPARVALEQGFVEVDGGRRELSPGMAVQVEIHTGTRRIIEYFLSPLRKTLRESIRER